MKHVQFRRAAYNWPQPTALCSEPTTPTMKNTTNDLPPELQAFASLLDAHPPDVQQAFQFQLATAMHEAGKSELLSVAEVEGRWHYTFRGAGDVFSVVRPEMSKEMERWVTTG